MNYSVKRGAKNLPHILVVDDDQEYTSTLKSILHEYGFLCKTSNNGSNVLSLLKKETFDCILLDVLMPGMNGLDLARLIKENQKHRFVPVIIISACDSNEDKIAGLEFADDYMTKPYSFEELVARIKALLRISMLQEELRYSTMRYQSLYENMPEMCLSLDKARIITDCNTHFTSCFSISRDEIVGKSIDSIFHPDESGQLKVFFESLKLQQIQDNKDVFRLILKDQEVFVTLRAVCLGPHESGVYIVISLKDVTATIQMENQQKMARQQLYRSARLASIGTLASGTAHEMNNPLTAILGFSDALLFRIASGEALDQEELKQYLSIIKRESIRCKDVVENLLKFSRDYESRTERVDLNECVRGAISLMNVRAQKKRIQIVADIDENIFVSTDAQKIGQILVNILSNSVDFCMEGSKVTIHATHPADPQGMVRLSVSDNGPGIPEDILPMIFDPFFTTKEIGKGLGFGMSISHKLIEDCGGTIDVLSKVNEGTTVILEIPCI